MVPTVGLHILPLRNLDTQDSENTPLLRLATSWFLIPDASRRCLTVSV